MSIDWNWGIFLQQAPFGNTTYLGWIWSGFQVTIALSICAWIIAFLVGSFRHFASFQTVFSPVLGTLYVELFRNVPLIVQFFTWYLVIPELCRRKSACRLRPTGSQYSVFPFIHALPGAVYRRPCLRTGTRRDSVAAARAKKCRAGDGSDASQTYRYVLLPNAYRVIVPPMTSEMMNLVKNSAIASTIGLVDMAAQAGKLLDYSARAWESCRHHAGVCVD